MNPKEHFFLDSLIKWHRDNPRPMPWKENIKAYTTWLSEVILQQTRVDQGTSYYRSFVEKYPTVQDLANASEDEVLKLWEGLGYYSRARNLHKTAKIVCEKYNGVFPEHYDELINLPGIGPYTAAAISSFVTDAPNPVVDGNVYRVISRFFGIERPIDTKEGKKEIYDISQKLISYAQPSEYNQAIMNFGAIACKPKRPICIACSMKHDCFAFKENKVDFLPLKSKKLKKKNRYLHFLFLKTEDSCIIEKRGEKGIWAGLYQFPILESDQDIELSYETIRTKADNYSNTYTVLNPEKVYQHKLTHQDLKVRFYKVICNKLDVYNPLEANEVRLKSLNNYAFPRLIKLYLNRN